MKIDETLRGRDGAETVDEMVYNIGQKKKAITDALESVMKSAAIDCELNIKQNYDGTFKCDSLKGNVGDFLYHPDIDVDIRESASKYGIAPSVAVAAAVAPAKPVAEPNFILKKLKDTIYRMKEIKDSTTGVVTGFEMYAADDKTLSRLLGTSGAKDGKPTPPIKFV
jgi:putative heme degradation protein